MIKSLAADRPYWLLIAVLASSIPLSEDASLSLYDAACQMLEAGEGQAELRSRGVSGSIRNVGSDVVVGTLGGPLFEADVIAGGSSGHVRFLVTHQGMALREEERPPRRLPN